MISICRRFEFHAAHHLPAHEGKCKNVHGHSYLLEIEITGRINEGGMNPGMIMDFGMVKDIVEKKILSRVDHQDLNTIWENPTAEVMVGDFVEWLKGEFWFMPKALRRIRLNETSNSYAEWRVE